ncbi:hypothetical protein HZS_2839, partial [Henneguya salminicola]
MIALHCGLGKYRLESTRIDELTEFLNKICSQAIFDLTSGCSSLDTVTKVVSQLENCEYTNAGIGSSLTRQGMVEMEAAVMESSNGLFGGVSCVRNVKNPVVLAKELLTSQKKVTNELIMPQYLSGDGTTQFALQHNIPLCENAILLTKSSKKNHRKFLKLFNFPSSIPNDFSRQFDTVGAICVDKFDVISVAASSGGLAFRPEGRVGHVSLPCGSGIWVDKDLSTAACTTGVGEFIARELIARKVCDIFLSNTDFDVTIQLNKTLSTLTKKSNPGNWEPLFGGLLVRVPQSGPKRIICFLTGYKMMIAFSTIDKTHVVQTIEGP